MHEIKFSLEELARPPAGGAAEEVYLLVAGMLGEARISRVFPEDAEANDRYAWQMTPGLVLRPAKGLLRRSFEEHCGLILRFVLLQRVTFQYLEALALATQLAKAFEQVNRYTLGTVLSFDYPELELPDGDQVIGDFTLNYDVVGDEMHGMMYVGRWTWPAKPPVRRPRPGVGILDCECKGAGTLYRVAIGVEGATLGNFSCMGPGLGDK